MIDSHLLSRSREEEIAPPPPPCSACCLASASVTAILTPSVCGEGKEGGREGGSEEGMICLIRRR